MCPLGSGSATNGDTPPLVARGGVSGGRHWAGGFTNAHWVA